MFYCLFKWIRCLTVLPAGDRVLDQSEEKSTDTVISWYKEFFKLYVSKNVDTLKFSDIKLFRFTPPDCTFYLLVLFCAYQLKCEIHFVLFCILYFVSNIHLKSKISDIQNNLGAFEAFVSWILQTFLQLYKICFSDQLPASLTAVVTHMTPSSTPHCAQPSGMVESSHNDNDVLCKEHECHFLHRRGHWKRPLSPTLSIPALTHLHTCPLIIWNICFYNSPWKIKVDSYSYF